MSLWPINVHTIGSATRGLGPRFTRINGNPGIHVLGNVGEFHCQKCNDFVLSEYLLFHEIPIVKYT